jgi:epoxide hydrolase-like predicted phosphatase
MSSRRFGAVLFDFGGVLITPITDKVQRVAERAGVTMHQMLEVLMGTHDSTHHHPWHRAERGEIAVAEIQGLLGPYSEAAGIPMIGDEVEILLAPATYSKHQSLVDRIATLKGQGLMVGLLTNSFREFRPQLGKELDLDQFDVIVDSSEVGSRKPEPEVYRAATRLFGLEPAEIIYLDDFIQNVEGARREGWEVIHVLSEGQALAELNWLVGTP